MAIINKQLIIKNGLNPIMIDDVIQDAKKCDDCGVWCEKDRLIRHFNTPHLVCRNCIADYNRMYKENKK